VVHRRAASSAADNAYTNYQQVPKPRMTGLCLRGSQLFLKQPAPPKIAPVRIVLGVGFA
jgi:hypothetical protein